MKIFKLKNSLLAILFGLSILSCSEGGKFDYNKNVILITGTEITPITKFVVEDTPSTYAVTATSTHLVEKDVNVNFTIDNTQIDAYNKEHGTNYYAVPNGAVALENANSVIQAGKSFSTPAIVKMISTEDLLDGRVYVIPVTISSTDDMEILKPSQTIFLQVSRVIQFTSLDISNSGMYSNFMFDDDKMQELSNFTYEIKFYHKGNFPTSSTRISRMCSFTSKEQVRSSMLRFGEIGQDRNALQWVSPTGSIVSTTRFDANRWYMISLTYDGSKLTMYVDGIRDAQGDGDGKPVEFQQIELGMSWTGYRSSQQINARISEVRIWNRALGSAELQMGLCGVDPQSKGLVAYWKMNEGTGHIFKDATGNGYDIDWSNTVREISEGAGNVYNLDYSNYVSWNSDETNKCNQ